MSDPAKPLAGLPDPFAMWRGLLTKGETQSNAVLNRAMGSEAFSALFGRSNALVLGVQGLLNELLPKYLAAMHMPSREEVSEIGERLTAIEDQLIRLSDAIARISPAPGPSGERPPKTRKSPPRPGNEALTVVAAPALLPVPVARKRAPARKTTATRGRK